MGFRMLTCLGARTVPAKDKQADQNMSPPLPKWRPRRTVIDLYTDKDKTLWYWRVAATLSAFLIMLGYVLIVLQQYVQADNLKISDFCPRLPNKLLRYSVHQAVHHCGYNPPSHRLRPLSCRRSILLQLGVQARHSLCSLPYVLLPRTHQCCL